jgi:ribosome-associated toxin RatA of RatAB toxin-antitoxin module
MTRALHTIDVAVSPEQFLAVVQDYARYPEFQPDVKSVRVAARTGERVEVTYTFDAKLMMIEYTLEHTQRSPLRIEWRLLRGDLLKQNTGAWELEPLPEGGTRVTYSIDLAFAGPIPAGLPRALAEQALPRMLGNFKARAEKLSAKGAAASGSGGRR